MSFKTKLFNYFHDVKTAWVARQHDPKQYAIVFIANPQIINEGKFSEYMEIHVRLLNELGKTVGVQQFHIYGSLIKQAKELNFKKGSQGVIAVSSVPNKKTSGKTNRVVLLETVKSAQVKFQEYQEQQKAKEEKKKAKEAKKLAKKK